MQVIESRSKSGKGEKGSDADAVRVSELVKYYTSIFLTVEKENLLQGLKNMMLQTLVIDYLM